MVASRGGYRMARGRHYAKLSLSNAARLSFSDLCILLFMFLSLCRLCVCVFLCSHWSLVDVPLIFFCPADHVPDWQPRVLLGMVEARSVNVKKTTTTTNRDSNHNKKLCNCTRNGTDQCQNGSSNLLTPNREQPRSTRIVVAYPRPPFSITKRTNYAPTSFDQQVQVSQGHTSYKNKENCNTEVHGGGGLDLVKPTREPASSRSKPPASLKKSHESRPFAAPCGSRRKKKYRVRHERFSQKPSGSRL